MLSDSLKKALHSMVHEKDLARVMDYAVFPAGKLFRPRLVEAVSLDLNGKLEKPHLHLASALELHHAYTLVHDDLPAMDNDLMRRGRPATHVQFGEWKAILAGDALLIASFDELMKMQHPQMISVHRLFSWATGAKGLILGQYLDLGAGGKLSVNEVVRIHELKTARLIQIATLGSYLLSSKQPTLRGKIEFLRLGREIGVSFQLLDDLNELTVHEITEHEKEINPFLTDPSRALTELRNSIDRLKSLLKKHQLQNTLIMIREYLGKNQSDLQQSFDVLEKNIGNKKVTGEMKGWLTSFASV